MSIDGPSQWTCTICNTQVPLQSRELHLSGCQQAVVAQQGESSNGEGYLANDNVNYNHNNSNFIAATSTPTPTPARILPAISGVAGITPDTIFAASDATEVDGAPGVLVWLCSLCNCCVPLSVKHLHLSSVEHIHALLEMIKITCTTIPNDDIMGGTSDTSGYENVAYETKRLAGRIREQNSHGEASAAESSAVASTSFLESTAPANMVSNPEDHGTPVGPLDAFFASFHGYQYDPLIPPAESFSSLRRDLEWWNEWDGIFPDTWEEYDQEVMARYQAALTQEFNLWFGTEDDIGSWHSLFRAIGIRPLPTTCDECREVVQNIHVNIVDLIEWARKREAGQVDTFPTVKELSDYSYAEYKIYQKDQLGQGAVLRYLLRELAKEQRSLY